MSEGRTIPYVNLVSQHLPLRAMLHRALDEVLDHGQLISGPEVTRFEVALAQLCRVPYAVGVSSGTDALELALRTLSIGPGDEVITVPNSFVATASCIVRVGATPVFVDVGDDYNLAPECLSDALTPRTRAILPVHLTGRPADLDPILEFAARHDLRVVEDCAQAIAAEYKGKPVGGFGDIGCFSLHPLKTLNALGDAGALTLRSPNYDARLRILRNIGLKDRDTCVEWSGNTRLDSLQAAFLLSKLPLLDSWTQRRRENASSYRSLLSDVSELILPDEPPHLRSVYHTFVVRAKKRDALRAFLDQHGVGTAIHYPIPLHLHPCARELGLKRGAFPRAEQQADEILSLPIYPELTQDDLEYVTRIIRRFYRSK